MKTRQAELRAIPQFDCGRWKLRLEFLQFPSRKQIIDMHDSGEIKAVTRNRIFLSASRRFKQDTERFTEFQRIS